MEIFLTSLVIGTTIWVGYDSSTNKITPGTGPYTLTNGALIWVLACGLLWLIIFPGYLVRRGRIMRERSKSPLRPNYPGAAYPAPAYGAPAPAQNLAAELEKLAALRAAGHLTEGDYERAKARVLR
jgi:hypothetical protein